MNIQTSEHQGFIILESIKNYVILPITKKQTLFMLVVKRKRLCQ
jgi:hypothetical protein